MLSESAGPCYLSGMSHPLTAAELIETLRLAPHPEGGFFAETFRSTLSVTSSGHEGSSRSASTAIYFLLHTDDFSAFHSVRSDEVWHHYLGDALELTLLHADGRGEKVSLGSDFTSGQRPQFVVQANVLQAAKPLPGKVGFTLCGCTVAPGFEFRDFEMPKRAVLVSRFPAHAEWIAALTRT